MNREIIISNYINYLRFNKGKQVKQIMSDTGLSRSTLLDLEKQKRPITDYNYKAFESAYSDDFIDYVDGFEENQIVIDAERKSQSDEFKQLAKAMADLSMHYTEAVNRCIELEKENKRLRKLLESINKK